MPPVVAGQVLAASAEDAVVVINRAMDSAVGAGLLVDGVADGLKKHCRADRLALLTGIRGCSRFYEVVREENVLKKVLQLITHEPLAETAICKATAQALRWLRSGLKLADDAPLASYVRLRKQGVRESLPKALVETISSS
jgi:hypothetical protein